VVIPFPQAGHFDPVPARVLGGVEAIIRQLLKAIATVQAGGTPPLAGPDAAAAALQGPDTMDCIAPAADWQAFWQRAAAAKRAGAAWLNPAAQPVA